MLFHLWNIFLLRQKDLTGSHKLSHLHSVLTHLSLASSSVLSDLPITYTSIVNNIANYSMCMILKYLDRTGSTQLISMSNIWELSFMSMILKYLKNALLYKCLRDFPECTSNSLLIFLASSFCAFFTLIHKHEYPPWCLLDC